MKLRVVARIGLVGIGDGFDIGVEEISLGGKGVVFL